MTQQLLHHSHIFTVVLENAGFNLGILSLEWRRCPISLTKFCSVTRTQFAAIWKSPNENVTRVLPEMQLQT